MPVELSWLVPDKILLSRWTGDITNEDIAVLIEEMEIVLDAANTLIHAVVDVSRAGNLNPALIYLFLESRIPYHAWRGRLAVVPLSSQAERLVGLLNHLAHRELARLFDTRELARDYLLAHDTPPPSLAAGPADNGPTQHAPENNSEGSYL